LQSSQVAAPSTAGTPVPGRSKVPIPTAPPGSQRKSTEFPGVENSPTFPVGPVLRCGCPWEGASLPMQSLLLLPHLRDCQPIPTSTAIPPINPAATAQNVTVRIIRRHNHANVTASSVGTHTAPTVNAVSLSAMCTGSVHSAFRPISHWLPPIAPPRFEQRRALLGSVSARPWRRSAARQARDRPRLRRSPWLAGSVVRDLRDGSPAFGDSKSVSFDRMAHAAPCSKVTLHIFNLIAISAKSYKGIVYWGLLLFAVAC
jgi:hypothetical protein